MIIGEFKYLQARILHNKYKEAMNFWGENDAPLTVPCHVKHLNVCQQYLRILNLQSILM